MPIPQKLKDEYLKRLDELIDEGQALAKSATADPHVQTVGGLPAKFVDASRLYEWRTKLGGLLMTMVPEPHPQRYLVAQIAETATTLNSLIASVATVKGLRDNFSRGYFDDLHDKIEAELAADYLGQAEQLLREGQPGKYDHVPAAVLTGAVLEKNLRHLCAVQSPPIGIEKADGSPKMMNALIDELKKAGAFNEIQAKQLRGYADIRNAAAHGNFSEFTRAQVENMIQGVQFFLASH